MNSFNVGVGTSTTRKQNGITLIALIITIIVLLILAGVSISLITGQDSIVGKANEAKSSYNTASQTEADTINELVDMLDGGNTTTGIQQIDDDEGETVPVPVGFRYLTGTKATGFVIENVNDHNEFVWIPCDLESNNPGDGTIIYKTYDWSKGEAATAYREYYTSDATTNTNIISAIDTSVGTYKGYYISRYEAGTTTKRTTEGQPSTTVVSRPTSVGTPVYAYNYVTWNQAISLAGNLYIKDTENADENQRVYVQSRLINARGWDTALKFIEQEDSDYPTNSTDKGWYSNNKSNNSNYETGKPVGANANMIKNIYDMGGNMWEWTATKYIPGMAVPAHRGGSYIYAGSGTPAAYRGGGGLSGTDVYVSFSFRLALYL